MVPTLVSCLACIRLQISVLIISIVIGHLCYAQEEKNSRLIVLPVIFSSPETSLGFGGAAIRYFRTDTSALTKPSNIRAIFIYTLENQMLSQLPIELFLDNNKYWLKIKLNYYLYPFEFYGIGNQIDLKIFDSYDATYFGIEGNALQRFRLSTYLGPIFNFRQYITLKGTSENGNHPG